MSVFNVQKLFVSAFHQVSGLQVGEMQFHCQGISGEGIGNVEAAHSSVIVETAHVPADSDGLKGFETHEAFDEIDGFFTVPVGELIIDAVIGYLLPLSGRVVLYVSGGFLVEVGLAQIVEKGTDRDGLLGLAVIFIISFLQQIIHVERVDEQSFLACSVKLGACGGFKEVGAQYVRGGSVKVSLQAAEV